MHSYFIINLGIWDEQVFARFSLSNFSLDQLFCVWEGMVTYWHRSYDGSRCSVVSASASLLLTVSWLREYFPDSRLVCCFLLLLQEQKIREGLYMMGLKDGIFHLSWFITYAAQASFYFSFWLNPHYWIPSLHLLGFSDNKCFTPLLILSTNSIF